MLEVEARVQGPLRLQESNNPQEERAMRGKLTWIFLASICAAITLYYFGAGAMVLAGEPM
jgi:hypothetical protein